MKKGLLILMLLIHIFPKNLAAQNDSNSFDTTNRRALVWAVNSGITVATHVALYKTWYSTYSMTPFHWKNDRGEWLDMDKCGHFFSAYFLTAVSSFSFRYAGYSRKKSAIFGTATALVFQTTIEYFDGRSTGWGASKSDLIANSTGALFGGIQDFLWGGIRLPMRITFRQTQFAALRPDVLGNNLPQRLLKDYNGQTYWLDINLRRMRIPNKVMPDWLGISLGYSAEGMLGGYGNVWTDIKGMKQDYSKVLRYRQFLISPSLALGYIKTKKKWLHYLLSVTNYWRLPMPALEMRNTGGCRFHLLYW